MNVPRKVFRGSVSRKKAERIDWDEEKENRWTALSWTTLWVIASLGGGGEDGNHNQSEKF